MSSLWALNDPQAKSAVAAAATTVHNPNTKEGKNAIAGIIDLFSPSGPIQSSIAGLDRSIQSVSDTINGANSPRIINEDVYKRLKYQYANLYVATAVGGVSQGLGSVSDSINRNLDAAANNITNTLKPVSSFIGSTLYTLTGVMKDPLGAALDLPNTVASMMDRVNPGFKAKYVATIRKYNIDKLTEMPGQLFGSAQQLIRSVDKILALPVNLISDIYKGFMDLIGQVNDFINGLFETLQKFFNKIIDGLFPGLTDFLNQLTAFANQISGIAQIFGGANQISSFTNQLIGAANQLNGFIQSPIDFAFAYAPPEVSTALNYLQNPQQIINNYLPPQLSEAFANIQNITGFGFNGNMGFGLQSVLEGFQGGVLSSILQGFATQFSILSPLFTGQSVIPNFYPNETTTATTSDGTPYEVDPVSGQIGQTFDPRQRPNYGP